MHGPRSQNAPERGVDQCEQPDGAGRWCRQMVPADGASGFVQQAWSVAHGKDAPGAGTPCRRSMQSLRTNARRSAPCNRPAKSFAQTLSAFARPALRANARHIRSTTRWNSRAGPHGEDVFATNAGFLANFVDFWRWTSTIRRQEDLASHVRAPLPTLLACFYS